MPKPTMEIRHIVVLGKDCDMALRCTNVCTGPKYWLPFLKQDLKADEESILVGHSSGAVAALRFAEKHRILGSVLVGVYYTDLGDEKEKESGYFDRLWNWKAIRNNQKWIIEFASTDDPWIPIEEPRFIRDKLDAQYYEYTDQGHFHEKERIPELLAVLKQKLTSS